MDTQETYPAEQNKATLYKKMAAVMADMEYVPTDGTHAQGYKYASASAVANEIRKNMGRHNLALFVGVVKIDSFDDSYLITYEFTFACGDTGATESRLWLQEAMKKTGNYRDDKAFGKAATYAEKYFLMKTFIVSSGDDPDIDASNEKQPSAKNAAKSQNKGGTSNASQSQVQSPRENEIGLTQLENEPTIEARIPQFKHRKNLITMLYENGVFVDSLIFEDMVKRVHQYIDARAKGTPEEKTQGEAIAAVKETISFERLTF